MATSNKAIQQIEQKVSKIEKVIEEKGLGSDYLNKAKSVQKDINLALIIGGAIGLIGVSAWALLKD